MRFGPLLLLLLTLSPAFATEERSISLSEWALPWNGDKALRHPVLAAAINAVQTSADSRLEIRFPGGDEGSLRAGELRAWLVALGLESDRIELVPGSSAPDRIDLWVNPPRAHD